MARARSHGLARRSRPARSTCNAARHCGVAVHRHDDRSHRPSQSLDLCRRAFSSVGVAVRARRSSRRVDIYLGGPTRSIGSSVRPRGTYGAQGAYP